MNNINVNETELFGIIGQLEVAGRSFNGLGDSLTFTLNKDELEFYEKAESLLRDSISKLKNLAVHPEEAICGVKIF